MLALILGRRLAAQFRSTAAQSPNYDDESPDDLQPLIRALSDESTEEDELLLLLILKSIKVLSRKYDNRVDFGEGGCVATVRVLERVPERRVAAEACNVVLNVCYEKPNVAMMLAAGLAAGASVIKRPSPLNVLKYTYDHSCY